MVADEATLISPLISLFQHSISVEANHLSCKQNLTFNFQVLKNGRGFWKLQLSTPLTSSQDKAVLHRALDKARLLVRILNLLGLQADVKASSRKGILIIWKKPNLSGDE